jgi:hypothetical protein
MNATIGIYDTHDMAVAAAQKLHDKGFPMSDVTIMGLAETEDVDNKMRVSPHSPLKVAGLEAGTVLGATVGVLTGVGIFAIPGLGFLYGAGALVGAIAGFDFGLIGGGIASALATIGVKDENAKKYHDALVAGKFLVVVHGNENHVNEAKNILNNNGHLDLQTH